MALYLILRNILLDKHTLSSNKEWLFWSRAQKLANKLSILLLLVQIKYFTKFLISYTVL